MILFCLLLQKLFHTVDIGKEEIFFPCKYWKKVLKEWDNFEFVFPQYVCDSFICCYRLVSVKSLKQETLTSYSALSNALDMEKIES